MWIAGFLRKVFSSGKRQPPAWNNLHLMGERGKRVAFLSYSGLTANGTCSQRRAVKQFYRLFGGVYDFWQRNLFGHTGKYGDFRRSRMWDWVSDACRTIAEIFERKPNRELFLIGESTGALVVTVAAFICQLLKWCLKWNVLRRIAGSAWLRRLTEHPSMRFWLPRTNHLLRLLRAVDCPGRIAGVVLVVPAFRLLNRRNEALLACCLVLYYGAAFAGQVAALRIEPWLLPILVVNYLLFLSVFSRIWIPSGNAFAESKSEVVKPQNELMIAASCFYFGLFPLVSSCLSLLIPGESCYIFQIWYLVTLLLPFTWTPVNGNGKHDEESEHPTSAGYYWLPVITTATLLLLQVAARIAIRFLDCDLIVVFAKADAVVDNRFGTNCVDAAPSASKDVIHLEGFGHTGWSQGQQDCFVSETAARLLPRIARCEESCA